MWRLGSTIIGTAAVVAFSVANTHHVELSFVFGPPVRVRMIFLLLSTFSLGYVVAMLTWQVLAIRRRRTARKTGVEPAGDLME